MPQSPIILWLRRDLRLADQPMLAEAARTGRPLILAFLLDPETEAMGAAPLWRLGLAVESFATWLAGLGQRLILRRGLALQVLRDLVAETGATAVWWSRAYDPASIARDSAVKAALRDQGIDAQSFYGATIWEPWQIKTGSGTPYRVFTPYWKNLRQIGAGPVAEQPASLPAPQAWPRSDTLADWQLGRAMQRGAAVVYPHLHIGEQAAQARLAAFLERPVTRYAAARDFMAEDATSGLSENLAWGEIGPRQIWHAGWRALQEGASDAETFLKELAWREFAWHLIYHFPQMAQENWRADWGAFPWRGDNPDAERWRRGMTGEPVVDAAMRELYVTGRMHNRARMITASYLTKHLLTDWRVGLAWFGECLIDWDPAANAMGWQWVAGSGPDASPFFRIFNPATQAEKFDPNGQYRARYLAEGKARPDPLALRYFEAVPKSWGMSADDAPPRPLITLAAGRARALAAYQGHRDEAGG